RSGRSRGRAGRTDPADLAPPACRAPWSWGLAEGATVARDEVLEAVDPEGPRPLGALRLPAVGLDHVDDRLRLRSEEPPEMSLATADPPEIEDRVGGRLGLVGVHLAEAVERDPRRGDPAPGDDPRPQRLLARERLDVRELRTVIDRHAVGGQDEPHRERRTVTLEERLRLVAEPERAGFDEVGPRLDDRALGDQRPPSRDLGLRHREVQPAHGKMSDPSTTGRECCG